MPAFNISMWLTGHFLSLAMIILNLYSLLSCSQQPPGKL